MTVEDKADPRCSSRDVADCAVGGTGYQWGFPAQSDAPFVSYLGQNTSVGEHLWSSSVSFHSILFLYFFFLIFFFSAQNLS